MHCDRKFGSKDFVKLPVQLKHGYCEFIIKGIVSVSLPISHNNDMFPYWSTTEASFLYNMLQTIVDLFSLKLNNPFLIFMYI